MFPLTRLPLIDVEEGEAPGTILTICRKSRPFVRLEVELRNAIAHGRRWLATEADLKTIQALCISGQCVGETLQDLAGWQKPLRIELAGPSGGCVPGRRSITASRASPSWKRSSAQFPSGTGFVLAADQADGQAAAALREFITGRGFVIFANDWRTPL